MPYYMSGSIQAIVIGDKVYVGGGYTPSPEIDYIVMVYSLASGSWSKLPPHKTRWFGMAAVNNQLILVGGNTEMSYYTNKATGILAMRDKESRTWTCPFPEMPTPWYLQSVVSYQKWLVVAGGKTGKILTQTR